jgi:hypothetical protein
MNWFKQHQDTLAIIGFIVGALIWTNARFSALEKDITIIKTVIMNRIMPAELVDQKISCRTDQRAIAHHDRKPIPQMVEE